VCFILRTGSPLAWPGLASASYLHGARADLGMDEKLPTRDPELRELTKLKAFDRQMHIERSLEAGMTREDAERHADEHIRERDDTRA